MSFFNKDKPEYLYRDEIEALLEKACVKDREIARKHHQALISIEE